MIDFFARMLGYLLKYVYEFCINIGLDTKSVSAYALAIIITTVLFRLLILPINLKQTKSMKDMQRVQPMLDEIQKKYKNDPEKLNQETMNLYKEHKISPIGGCLPLLIQFPILIAYFRVMQEPVKYVFGSAEVFDAMNKGFLWIHDISLKPTAMLDGVSNDLQIAGLVIPVFAVISAITTFFSTKMMSAQQKPVEDKKKKAGPQSQMESTQKIMNYMMPLMFLYFGYQYPVGFTLYWTVSNIFQIVQYSITNKLSKKKDEELFGKVEDKSKDEKIIDVKNKDIVNTSKKKGSKKKK